MNYHNPEQLTEWGQADGWRLLTTEEIKQPLPDDAQWFLQTFNEWEPQESHEERYTYRTKKPLPVSPLIAQLDAEIKAKQELREIALAVEAGAEWEVYVGKWENPIHSLKYYIDQGMKVRLKPKLVTRDWNKPEDVPLNCYIGGPDSYQLLTGAGEDGVVIDGTFYEWNELAGKRYTTPELKGEWKPCETTEEAK